MIVVEGKNDTKAIQRAIPNAQTIETSGSGLTLSTLNYIKKMQVIRGIIIFTDPDSVGEKIRHEINQAVPNCKNAFIMKEKARTLKKVGVEHASNEDIYQALENLLTYHISKHTLEYKSFIDLGLSGQPDSKLKREKISLYYSIGKCNAKTMWKRLNMLRITNKEIEKVLKSI